MNRLLKNDVGVSLCFQKIVKRGTPFLKMGQGGHRDQETSRDYEQGLGAISSESQVCRSSENIETPTIEQSIKPNNCFSFVTLFMSKLSSYIKLHLEISAVKKHFLYDFYKIIVKI